MFKILESLVQGGAKRGRMGLVQARTCVTYQVTLPPRQLFPPQPDEHSQPGLLGLCESETSCVCPFGVFYLDYPPPGKNQGL